MYGLCKCPYPEAEFQISDRFWQAKVAVGSKKFLHGVYYTYELCLSISHAQPVTRCRVASCFTGVLSACMHQDVHLTKQQNISILHAQVYHNRRQTVRCHLACMAHSLDLCVMHCSADMLEDIKVPWVILGHSERRSLLNESEDVSEPFLQHWPFTAYLQGHEPDLTPYKTRT